MPKAGSLADVGEIMQLAFLPKDFDAAVKYWTETMGVGPFYLLENIRLGDMKYKGEPTEAVFSVAIAYWNDIQIELVRPENDALAHYSGEHAVHDRVQHVCITVDDIADAYKACEAAGAEILVEGKVGKAGAVIYADPGYGPGGVVEFVQLDKGGPEWFAMIKAEALDWDGTDPLRKIG